MPNLSDDFNFLSIALLFLGLIIGGFSSKFIHLNGFTVQRELDLVAIVSTFITVLLAIYIAQVIEKNKSDKRTGKDLLIGKTNDIEQNIESIRGDVIKGKLNLFKATSLLKSVSVNANLLFKYTSESYNASLEGNEDRVRDKIQTCRKLLTDTPTKDGKENSDPPIEVKDNVIHFSSNRIRMIENEFRQLRNLFFEIKLKINQC